MKQLSLRFACVLLAAFAFTTAWAQTPPERAHQVLDQLEAGQFDEVAAVLAPQLSTQLDAATLGQTWNTLVQQVGPLQSRGEPVESTLDEHRVVVIPLTFERMPLVFTVSFDAEDRMSTLLLQAAQPPAATEGPDA